MPNPSPSPTPAPTPDNTPLPGGGSWRWSTARAGWVPSDIADAAASAAGPTAALAAKPLKSQE